MRLRQPDGYECLQSVEVRGLYLHLTAVGVAGAEVAGGAELLGQGSQLGLGWVGGRGVGAELGCEEARGRACDRAQPEGCP